MRTAGPPPRGSHWRVQGRQWHCGAQGARRLAALVLCVGCISAIPAQFGAGTRYATHMPQVRDAWPAGGEWCGGEGS